MYCDSVTPILQIEDAGMLTFWEVIKEISI